MNTEEINKITHKIIGCAMKVHSTMGNGFQEVIYQRALEIEMAKRKIGFQREFVMPIFYDEIHIGTRRVDFLIDDIIELKAVIQLEKVHFAQAINYLEAYHLTTRLLINFGARSLEYKRLFNKKISN
jgi:GxxExxY protein